jgi:hypothetical protein
LVEKQSQWTNAEIIYVACSFFFKEKEKIYDKNIVPCGYPICEIVKFQTTIGLEIEVIGNIHDNPELLK